MPSKNYHNIEERTSFYASKKLSEQLKAGDNYDNLKKVIIIAILDYNFIKLPEYVTKTIRVVEKHRNYELNNNVEYYYLELEKFRNSNPNMEKPINQWLAFIDMERKDLLEMAEKENKVIKEANKYYEELTGDEELKRLAEIRLMSSLEEQSALQTAKNDGIKEGKESEKYQTVKKMLEEKIPIEKIEKITGLNKQEIEKIAESKQ